MKRLLPILFLLVACSKSDDTKPAAPASGSSSSAPAPAPTPKPKLPDVAPDADFVHVSASHAKPKPSDPDLFDIPKFKIMKADFDPAKVEGGTADLELDLASLVSNSAKRDADVKGDDYLAVDKFATVTIHIDNVKKTGDNAYSADATVNAHGVEKKLPVDFTVLSSTADSLRIHGAHTFKRFDFAIGAPEGQDDSVGADVTIEMQLTLKKT